MTPTQGPGFDARQGNSEKEIYIGFGLGVSVTCASSRLSGAGILV